MKPFFIVGLFTLAPLVLVAEPAVAADETISPPSCEKPAVPSADAPADPDASRIKHKDSSADFQKQFDAYRDCMKTYVDSQSEASKKHIAAANAAVKDVNDFIAQVNAAK